MANNVSQLLWTVLEATSWPGTFNSTTAAGFISTGLLSTESSKLEAMTSSHIVVLLVAFIPLMLSILFGNFLVMVTVLSKRHLHTPTNFILGSLAVSDFLTGALTIPFELYTDAKSSTLDCYTVTYMLMPSYYLGSVSLMHQVIVTVDRLIAVCRPLRYHSLVTPSLVTMVICGVWILGTLPAIFYLYVWMDTMPEDHEKGKCGGAAYFTSKCITDFEISLSTFVLLILLLLTAFNVYIWRVAARQAQQIYAHLRLQHTEQRRKNLLSLQATKTVLFIVGTFIISWTPFSIYTAISSVIQAKVLDNSVVLIINQITYFFICVNSAINPLIYGWKNTEFRRALVDLVRRWKIACLEACQRTDPAKTIDEERISTDLFLTETAFTNLNYEKNHDDL